MVCTPSHTASGIDDNSVSRCQTHYSAVTDGSYHTAASTLCLRGGVYILDKQCYYCYICVDFFADGLVFAAADEGEHDDDDYRVGTCMCDAQIRTHGFLHELGIRHP